MLKFYTSVVSLAKKLGDSLVLSLLGLDVIGPFARKKVTNPLWHEKWYVLIFPMFQFLSRLMRTKLEQSHLGLWLSFQSWQEYGYLSDKLRKAPWDFLCALMVLISPGYRNLELILDLAVSFVLEFRGLC